MTNFDCFRLDYHQCLTVRFRQAGTETVFAEYTLHPHMPIPRMGEQVELNIFEPTIMEVLKIKYIFEKGIVEVLVA